MHLYGRKTEKFPFIQVLNSIIMKKYVIRKTISLLQPAKKIQHCIINVLIFSTLTCKLNAQSCTVNSGLNVNTCTSSATLVGNINGTATGSPAWSLVSGPAGATPVITTPGSLTTTVTGMTVPGTYVYRISQPCQLGGTATQDVTVVANPQPAFTVTGAFSDCSTLGILHNLTASPLLPGWTGKWKVTDIFGNDATAGFVFSNINDPVTTVRTAASGPACGVVNCNFTWEITSPNGLCKYSKSVNGIIYPDISLINYETNPKTICGPGSTRFYNTACGFWGITFSHTLTFNILSAPAGFSGSLSGGASSDGAIVVNGFSTPGVYTFTITLTLGNGCGSKTFGPFTVTVLPQPAAPAITASPASFCIRSAPASSTINFTVADPTVVCTITVAGPGPAPCMNYVYTGAGTTNRTITLTPNPQWLPGSYRCNISMRNAADINGTCLYGFARGFNVYDSIATNLTLPDVNMCVPAGSTTAGAYIPCPPFVWYLNLAAGSWNYNKVSGPAAGPAFFSQWSDLSAVYASGFVPGDYVYNVTPSGEIATEMACSNAPTSTTIRIHVYNQPGANAGSDQSIFCIQNFPLAGNLASPPSVGTWSLVSGPSTVVFQPNANDPNARAQMPGMAQSGSYTFRWTISDPGGACPAVTDDVVITSIGTCAPVPVTLVHFSAVKQSAKSLVQWQTATEQNTREFVVEWSRNGERWQALASIPAAGNSNSLLNYQYLHQNPAAGVNYYRLSQVDLDNRETKSKIVLVRFDDGPKISLLPNPVKDNLYISNLRPGSLLTLTGADGKTIWSSKASSENSTISMSSFASAIYLLRVTDPANGTTEIFKVVKNK